MKKLFTIAIIMVATLTTSNLFAQAGFKIGLAAEAALPLGNLKTAYNFGAGATVRAAYGIDETSAITLTTGALAFLPKDLTGSGNTKAQLNIPVKAGFKYTLGGNVYAIAEAGMSFIKSYYNVPGTSSLASVSTSEFTYAPGIGVQLGGFDASVRYEGYSGAGFAAVRLGFNF